MFSCFFESSTYVRLAIFMASYFTGKYLIHFEMTEMVSHVSQQLLLNYMFSPHLFEVLSLPHTKFPRVFFFFFSFSGQSIFFHCQLDYIYTSANPF